MRRLAALLLLYASPAGAQPPAPPARVDQSVSLRERWQWLTRDIASPPVWDDDGRHFHYRKTTPGGFAHVEVDAATFEKRPAFDAAAIAAGLSRWQQRAVDPLRLPFDAFRYRDAHRAIEMTVDGKRVRCTLVGDAICTAPPPEPEPRLRGFSVVRDLRVPADNHPRLSPDKRFEALVLDHRLVVRAAGGGTERWRSADGSAGDFYDPETIAWSPDGAHLAVFRVQPGFARMVTRVVSSPPGRVQPELAQQLYPKPGDAIDREQPMVFATDSGAHIAVPDALFPNAYELSAVRWRKDGRSFTFDYLRRGHQQARVIAVDAATGAARTVVSEDATTFVDADRRYGHDVGGLGRELIWASERDGWRHLYLVDAITGRIRQITRGKWVVRDIAQIDDVRRRIWFSAGGTQAGEDPYFKQWFRIDFDGRNLVRLTTAPATHELRFSPDMRRYVDVYSRVDLPDVAELHDAETGRLLAPLERGDISALTAAGFRPPEPFTAKGRDGTTDILGVVVRPRDWDAAKRYPVIENIYAGPHDSFVPKTFWPFGYHSGGDKVVGMQALADLGFVVVMIDGMGTANRSRAFHDVAWKNLADGGFPDRIAWIRALAARDPSLDLTRVGIYGASAGGQSALNALLFHPDFYRAAVAYAGCYDNRMDKISWNEQWLGWPVDDSYLAASGVVHAAELRGELMMIVGEQDSNVDPASTMQVVDALVRANKRFDLLVVPNAEHSVGRSTGPIDYVTRRQYDFFLRTLRGEGISGWNAVPR